MQTNIIINSHHDEKKKHFGGDHSLPPDPVLNKFNYISSMICIGYNYVVEINVGFKIQSFQPIINSMLLYTDETQKRHIVQENMQNLSS